MAEEKVPESPLVIDVVDNVSRGIADHYLLRESQGFFEKGENLVLNTSGRLQVHDGQKLLLVDENRLHSQRVQNNNVLIEGLFSLENKLLVCIIRGKFYYYNERLGIFKVLDKQLFPTPPLNPDDRNPLYYKTRRFQMVQQNKVFIFVCNDNYYRPVVIYLKLEKATDIDIFEYTIDGHYLGVPPTSTDTTTEKDGEITRISSIKVVTGAELKAGVIPDIELYSYAFCYSKSFKVEEVTFKEYGPISYIKGLQPKSETVNVDVAANYGNDAVTVDDKKSAPSYMRNSSFYKEVGCPYYIYNHNYYFIKEGTYELILYISDHSDSSRVDYRCLTRTTDSSSVWLARKFFILKKNRKIH